MAEGIISWFCFQGDFYGSSNDVSLTPPSVITFVKGLLKFVISNLLPLGELVDLLESFSVKVIVSGPEIYFIYKQLHVICFSLIYFIVLINIGLHRLILVFFFIEVVRNLFDNLGEKRA